MKAAVQGPGSGRCAALRMRHQSGKETKMKDKIDRRSFLRIAGASVGIGVFYEFAPFLERRAEGGVGR